MDAADTALADAATELLGNGPWVFVALTLVLFGGAAYMTGQALAQKGEDAPSQAQEAQHAMSLLGGELARVIPVDLPGVAETRYLIAVRKVASTPGQFPRRPGMPGKRPLG